MSVLLKSGLTAPKAADIRERWADATRHLRAEEADDLWRQLMEEWLKPLLVEQGYWDNLLDRRMAVLERREKRRSIDDDEWDRQHDEVNR